MIFIYSKTIPHHDENIEVNYADCSFITPDGDLRELCDWSDIIIFMVDISDRSSFTIVELLLTQIKRMAHQNGTSSYKSWFLIANKSDLSDRREVKVEDANRLGYLFSNFTELSVKESPQDVQAFEGLRQKTDKRS